MNGHEFEQISPEGQRSLTHYSMWGSQRVRHDLVTEQQRHLYTNLLNEQNEVMHLHKQYGVIFQSMLNKWEFKINGETSQVNFFKSELSEIWLALGKFRGLCFYTDDGQLPLFWRWGLALFLAE